jgi:hypothetical protein
VKFARHFAAALLAVAVVVALGVVWEHSSAARAIASPVPAWKFASGPGPGSRQPVRRLPPSHGNVRVIKDHGGLRVINLSPESGGLDVADLQDLTHTAVLEAAIAAVVVALSLVRRSRRRARTRARWRTADQAAGTAPPPRPEPAD